MHGLVITNKSQLRELLTINHPDKETMYGIVGRMEVLIDFFAKEPAYHSLIPFLTTYFYVTKASIEKYTHYRHYFWNLRDHETLDIYFATLYFKPLLRFLLEGKCESPWKQYFLYCQKPDGIPIIQILLGVNAHINTDLYAAVVNLPYKHEHDYFLINDILQEVVPNVMKYLTYSRHDLFGLTGLTFKDFIINEFHSVIERWRSEAWAHAIITKRSKKKETYAAIPLLLKR